MPSKDQSVLVIQHSDPEHPGLIGEVLAARGFECIVVRSNHGERIPQTLEGHRGLVVMGGPQGVYEQSKFPFLVAEKELIRRVVLDGRPLLGVCLGSQLLAEALGAKVYPGESFEVGWNEVGLAPETVGDVVFGGMPESFVPFHWHGDVFELPEGAIPLGASAVTAIQGFGWRSIAYGILCHLEMCQDQVDQMVALFPEDLERGLADGSTVREEAGDRLAALRGHAIGVFDRWAALL